MLAAEHKWAALSQKYSPHVRDLIVIKTDEALREQSAGVVPQAIEPLLRYLTILQNQMLLSSP